MKKITIMVILATFALSATTGLALNKVRQEQFDTGDKDGDAMLSEQEYVDTRLSRMKATAEKNDREFNEEKVVTRLQEQFDQADADGDGKLTEEEFDNTFQKQS